MSTYSYLLHPQAHMLCWLLHIPIKASVQAILVSAYIHSQEIRVAAERVQKQQHQVKDEAVLLLLEDETMDSILYIVQL